MRPIRSKPTAGWLSRDDRQILLLWLFFVVILVSSALIGGTLADGLRPKRLAKALADQSVSDGNAYTGSILFVSADGDNCWQRFWDNQTGRQWDSGLVPCAPHSMILQPGYSSGGRVDAIRKGFLGRGNNGRPPFFSDVDARRHHWSGGTCRACLAEGCRQGRPPQG
jgi:hypothetical protein